MNSHLTALLISLDIDCSEIHRSSSSTNDFKWKSYVCSEVFEGYSDVNLKAIRRVIKELNDAPREEILEASTPQGGRFVLTRTENNGSTWMQIKTYYKFEAFQEVWIAIGDLEKGSIISEKNVILKKKNISNYLGIKTVINKNPTGMYTKEKIRNGDLVFSDSISDVPLIKKGEELSIYVSSNRISFQMKGYALEDGFVENENIKVRLESTGKVMTGIIKSGNKIYVEI